MNITFGMIVFEGDYVLEQCLEQVYPFANQILIAEGPVQYWQDQGKFTSEDNTNTILGDFPDPENKIQVVHGQFTEKDDQCRAYMDLVSDDTDYIWNLDSDEVYKINDLDEIINVLEKEKPTSVGIRSCSFYGGFDRYLGGFELEQDNFLRIFKYMPGSNWKTHRPPTIEYPEKIERKHINSEQLFSMTGAQMYHYSYVFPRQVRNKIEYYKACVSKNLCIDNYFDDVYLPWVTAKDDRTRRTVENKNYGVHEFQVHMRGHCFTEKFTGEHPLSIANSMPDLKREFTQQLKECQIRKS